MGVGSSGGAGRRWRRSSCAPAATRSWPGTTAAAPARSTWSPSTARCSSSSRCGPGAGPPPARRSNPSSAASRRRWCASPATSSRRAAGTTATHGSTWWASASTPIRRPSSTCAAPSMLDIRLIRTEPDRVKAELAKVGFPAFQVDALLDADRRRREALHALEQLRAERTAASKTIRDIRHSGQREQASAAPPAMVKGECLVGTGNLPKFADTLYRDVEEDHWFVPTAEVPVTNLYRDEILERLPVHHVAYTPCFRREKMSAGRDVRGIKRGHQFDKVELVKFVRPETSDAALMGLLDDAEDVCRRLDLAHRIVQMCTGDLAFQAAMKYDIEVWAPGSGEWLEVSSCSNFRDFQARRANIRYRPAARARPELVHTLNGSGLALPRVLIAVLETYQRADASIGIPEVLRPYVGADVIAAQDPT